MTGSFMFLIDFPEMRARIESIPAGFLPLPSLSETIRSKLIIKASKETILTAQTQGEFFIYRVPIIINGTETFNLITAFRDDYENPLTIFTPIIEENDLIYNIRSVICSKEFDVHFFDEHARERVAYTVKNVDFEHAKKTFAVAPASLQATTAKESYQATVNWFGLRTPEDDANSLRIPLEEKLYNDNFSIIDLGDAHTNRLYFPKPSGLVREIAGPELEEDIAQCFSRSFKNGMIFIGPMKKNNKELADIVVVEENNVILVQAKDSPNNEAMLSRSIERKSRASRALAEKGFSQVKGAIRSVQTDGLKIENEFVRINMHPENINLYAILVIKERFPDSYRWYYEKSSEITRDKGVMTVLLSYRQLHEITHHMESGKDFIGAITQMYFQGSLDSQFPELNFPKKQRIAHYTLRGND